MGARIDQGMPVTIDFREQNGNPSPRPSITTEFIEIFGTDRCNVLTKGSVDLPPYSDLGSEDWLTVVAIANSDANLATLKQYLADNNYCLEQPQTSASSYGVALAEYKDDGTIEIQEGCVTLATGNDVIVPPEGPNGKAYLYVNVNHIYVFPSGTSMSADSPFGLPWAKVAPTACLE